MIYLNNDEDSSLDSECYQWGNFIELFIRDRKIFNNPDKIFINELCIAEYLNKDNIRKMCVSYIASNKDRFIQNELKYETYKNEGNIFYKRNDLDNTYRALILYTKALFCCKEDTSAAFCHANRAACLIKFDFFEEACDDCETAIKCNYPYNKIQKVYGRIGYCAIKLKDEIKLKKVIDKLHELNKLRNQADIKREILKFENELIQLQKELSNITVVTKQSEQQHPEKNQRVLQDSNNGRFIVAGETIKKDDIICREKAYAFVPISVQTSTEYISCNCEACGKVNIIPFPCRSCSLVSYCSSRCRNQMLKLHEIECPGVRRKIFMQIGIGHLALRTLLVGINQLKYDLITRFNSKILSRAEVWEFIEYYKDNNTSVYASVLGLNTNLNKMNNLDYKRYALTGIMLMNYLKHLSNFFDCEFSKELYKIVKRSDWKMIISALIIRHLAQMVSNAHTINGFNIIHDQDLNIWLNKHNIKSGYLSHFANIPIFAAIYPQISLYNHSCEPSFYNRFKCTDLQLIAMKKFKENMEIFNCYGKNFKLMDRKTRIKDLEAQYHFTCRCEHCSNRDDTDFKRLHTLKCLQNSCKYEFCITSKWWEDESRERNVLQCEKCKIIFNFAWLKEWEDINSQLEFKNKSPTTYDLERLIKIFQVADNCLVGHHVYKQILMSKLLIIANQFLFLAEDESLSEEIVNNLLYIGVENVIATEDIFNYESLEYVTAAAYLLDLLVNLNLKQNPTKICYNVEKIPHSFGILSEEVQKVFINYFNTFATKIKVINVEKENSHMTKKE